MSGSRIMTWEGKKFNPRDEEKFLDDKLLGLGLLEPGMTLQEKRDMASAVLESTRMAQEQMSQKPEEQWEVMLMSKEDRKYSDNATSKGTEIDDNTDDSESTSVVQVSVNVQDDRDGQCIGRREFSRVDGDSRLEGNQRERRDKDGTREKKNVEKRAERFERDDDRVRVTNTKREKEKYEEDKRRREKDIRKKEEVDSGRDQGEVQKRKREQSERREDRMRGETRKAELEILIKKSEDKGCSIDELDTQKPNKGRSAGEFNIAKDSFYGPSYLRDVKHPNPFGSEIYGSAQKNHSHRVSKGSLIQLAEEAMQNKGVKLAEERTKKESSSHQDAAKGKIIGVKVMDRSSKKKDLSAENHDEDHVIILKKYRENQKVGDVEDKERGKESPGKENDNVLSKSKCKGGSKWPREAKKRAEPSKSVSVEREGGLSSQSGTSDHNLGSSLGNCEKRRRREANSDSSSTEEEVKEIELEGKGEEKEDDILNADIKTLGEKKRRLEKGHLAKRWSDVVKLKTSEASETEKRDLSKESTEAETKKGIKPNKRWRRVRRKFKSSFGSGSEVDEWISSEEERKAKVLPLTKEQIGARFDDYLTRLRNELKKQGLKEADKGTEKLCSNSRRHRSKYKVPPGFQEPDSDDDWNLWKICFADKPSAKSKLGKDDTKTDVMQSSSRMVMTRSQMKQEGCLSPCSSSKSPSSAEEDHVMRRSPLCLSPMKAIMSGSSTHPNDDIRSTSKSPSLKEIKLFDKVTCPIPTISKGTQTLWDNDMDSTQSSSSSAAAFNSNPKPKDDNKETKPVWDLFDVDSEAEGGVETLENRRKNEDNKELVNVNVHGVTLRRPKINVRNSPVYLPVEASEDDAALSVSDGVETPDGIEGITENLSIEPVCEPSVSRAARRKEFKENTRLPGHRPDGRMRKKVDEKVKRNAEEENVEQEVQLISEEESPVELPELVACPICNHVYPMSEIETHASGCNPEEDDESSEGEVSIAPQLAKDHHHNVSGGVTAADSAGASRQRLKMEVDEEMDYNDDNDFEDPEEEECKPRPPPLATFIPISQQKDSLIDYSDQFPHRSGGVDLQSSLERMRKSLMRGGKRRTGWKKRKRGKWRRVAKK